MVIEKKLAPYTIFVEDSTINALKKMTENGSRFILAVSESGVLEGVMTDGDFRLWTVRQNSFDLNSPVSQVINRNFKAAKIDDDPKYIQAQFGEQIQFLPLVDSTGHLVAIAQWQADEIRIGDFTIDENAPTFIIAEIGINHNGSLDAARQLVDAAISSGANCAKFQMRDLASLYANAGNATDTGEDLGSQYILDLLSKFQLAPREMFAAFDHCRERGILPLCTPWDMNSLAQLEEYGMEAYKIASADMTNHDFLKALARTGKPLLCSTGMSSETEIIETVELLKAAGAPSVFLHCNSTYPAPFKDVHLNYLDRLQEITGGPIGYSGHERGIYISIAAVARGARVIEKHLTLDRTLIGNDHKISLLPAEFRAMVEGIRDVEQSLGSAGERQMSQGELMNRENLAKSLVITCELKSGEIIGDEMIEIKSPGKGLQPNRRRDLVGLPAKRDFKTGDFFFASDLLKEQVVAREYSFRRPWGVAVRYHDFKPILAKTNPDFLEFHLSYKDMEHESTQFFGEAYDLDLVVHSPDLFQDDHLLDLSALDEKYRQRSVSEVQRVLDLTRELKPYFKKASRPLVVASLGGFTKDAPLPESEKARLYDRIALSLSELDMDGVELIAQTLPPFPWYFGGQLFLNLFVNANDTAQFCRENNFRLCFDVSHSKLACNHFKWSFKEFCEAVGPHTSHLHIADAGGVDGEGLQIGEGDIDFPALAEYLDRTSPRASFIPEIWQGHKNEGEGFWIALQRLEGLL